MPAEPSFSLSPLSPRDVTRLRSPAARAEAAGQLQAQQLALIHRRRWLTMLAPQACGGAELPLPQAVRLEEAVAEADGSCGWVTTLCAGAGWFAGFLPPDFARELMTTRRVCLAGSGTLTGTADCEAGGYRLRGQWEYASGAPQATHFTLNAWLREGDQPVLDARGQPQFRSFVLPAAAVRVEPSWQAIGLRASATRRFVVVSQWVAAPQAFVIAPEHATAPGPLYRFPFLPLAYVTLAVNLSGMARHFVELAEALIGARRQAGGARLAERPAVQALLQGSRAELAQARAAFYLRLDAAWGELCAVGQLAPASEHALQQVSLALVRAARTAVDGLYPACGLQAARADAPINRVWRDFHTATQHSLLLPEAAEGS